MKKVHMIQLTDLYEDSFVSCAVIKRKPSEEINNKIVFLIGKINLRAGVATRLNGEDVFVALLSNYISGKQFDAIINILCDEYGNDDVKITTTMQLLQDTFGEKVCDTFLCNSHDCLKAVRYENDDPEDREELASSLEEKIDTLINIVNKSKTKH